MRRNWLVRLASLAATMTIAAVIAQGQTLPVGVYVNEAQNSEGIHAAIKANVDDAPFLFRKIVRKALLEVCPVYRRASIEQTAAEIVVTFDADKPMRMPSDGTAIKWTNAEGDVSDLNAVWRDGQLVQTFKRKEASRVHVFRFGADGRELILGVTLSGESLSSPIQYELTFRRQ